jgi:hypothetical protein
VYENTPEARELAEQARLRAEAEFEEKRLQMGLGPREKAGSEEEEWIGSAYVCRGTHCLGGQRKLSKSMEYIEYTCTERCLLVYHTGDCHRKDVKLRMEREHGVWKEEEGARCITPDCPGTLTKGTKWNRYGKVSYQVSASSQRAAGMQNSGGGSDGRKGGPLVLSSSNLRCCLLWRPRAC